MSVLQTSSTVTPALSAPPGSLLTYVVRITNTNNGTATNLVVSDTLSLALNPQDLGGATFSSGTRALTWPAHTLAPGASLTLTFTARITLDVNVINSLLGVVSNQATYSSNLDSGAFDQTFVKVSVGYLVYLPLVRRN